MFKSNEQPFVELQGTQEVVQQRTPLLALEEL